MAAGDVIHLAPGAPHALVAETAHPMTLWTKRSETRHQ